MKFQKLILLLIIAIAFLFRFNNLNWDDNHHLHPDERFLTMVGNAMVIPSSFQNYIDPATSTLNPANIGFSFYVYGTFPLILNKLLAIAFNTDTYNSFTVQGRALSALFDIFTLIIICKTVELLEKKYKLPMTIKYWTAFFYAIAVLPIQLSHYFAVDTFLSFFMMASLYFSLQYAFKKSFIYIAISAIFVGLALACKVTTVFILPLIFSLIFLAQIEFFTSNKFSIKKLFKDKNIIKIIIPMALISIGFFIISYFTLRLADPYKFQSNNIFNPTISPHYLRNLEELSNLTNKEAWFPPAVQWIHKTNVLFSLYNLAFFGVGVPYFAIFCLGVFFSIKLAAEKDFKLINYLVLFWIGAFFIYQSSTFTKTIRYFIFLYPFIAMYAAIGLWFITKRFLAYGKISMVIFVMIWPIAFSSIYINKHSRVQASEWIYENIPNNSVIAVEHWDDALPLPLLKNNNKQYVFSELPVFGPDNEEKWTQMNQKLQEADYYILSSNRAWGSIPTVPERYPQMTEFYNKLFADQLEYKKVKGITSYPMISIFGQKIQFNDDGAEETFTVYDHPKVLIYKKNDP